MRTLTYSALSAFGDCQRKYYWRYVRELVADVAPAQYLGAVVHDALEALERGISRHEILRAAWPGRRFDPAEKRLYQVALAMLAEYTTRYARFSVVALEHEFDVSIVNPATGCSSRSFRLRGKVDGIIQRHGLCLLETKTKTSSADDNALYEALWHDLQIALYYDALCRSSFQLRGVLYNVLGKPQLKQRVGETEPEFEERRRKLKHPDKAKRREPEPDWRFGARLAEWYARPESMKRVEVPMKPEHIERAQGSLWAATQQILTAHRDGFSQNLTACSGRYGRQCPYAPICSSGDSPMVIDTYHHKPAHSELTAKGEA